MAIVRDFLLSDPKKANRPLTIVRHCEPEILGRTGTAMDDLLNDFLAETAEILAEAGGALVAWETDPADRAQLDAIFRLVHTIKGSSGFLSLPRVTALSHAAEDALDQVRRGHRSADAALVTGVLAIIDRLSQLCTTLGQEGVEPPGEDGDVIGALIPVDEAPAKAADMPEIRLRREDDLSTDLQGWRSIRVPLPLLDSLTKDDVRVIVEMNGEGFGTYQRVPRVEIKINELQVESILPGTVEVTIFRAPPATATPQP